MGIQDQKLLAWIADGYKHKLFASEPKKEEAILPSDADNFVLLPDEITDTYAELRVVTPEPLQEHIRVRSAASMRTYHTVNRPGTAPARTRYVSPYAQQNTSDSRSSTPGGPRPSSSQTRVSSAGSARLSPRTLKEMRKGFTLVNKLYEREYAKHKINLHPAGPHPDFRYFDRHSRCYGYTHMHGDLLSDRPQTACDEHPCEGYSRPISALSNVSRVSGHSNPNTMHQPTRYINYHRPRSSPQTRRELSGLQRKPQLLRTVSGPRFCNIVKQKEIHKREKEEDSDEYGDGKFDYYRQNVNSPLITRWRKHSNASTTQEDIVNQIVNDMREPKGGKGGTEGRPGSPSSQLGLDNDHGQEASDTAEIKSSDDSDSKQIIPTKIDFPESKLDNSSDKPPMHLSHVIRVDITGKSPTELESNKTKNTSTTELNKITSVKDEPQETPKQPPPSPEPIPPKETIQVEISTPSVDKEKKRASISKKTKQSVQKVRKPKEEMEEKKEEPPVVPTPPPEPPKPEESPNKDIKVEVDLPSLPALQEEKKEKKKKNKAERHLVTQPKHEPPKIDPEELLDEQLKLRLKNFDFNMMEMGITEESPRKTTNKPSWNTGRLALSQQSSRFELPMDMKKLEQMSALEYIKSFCIISSRRRKLYYDIFTRHKEKQSNAIIYKDLEKALKSVLVNTLTSDHYHEIVDLLDITQQTKVDLDTFAAISALSERLLCTTYVTQEQVDMPDYQKDKIECADFSALDWKLHGVNASPKIVKLLKQLS